MKIRCTLDGLLLDAEMHPREGALIAYDGPEAFRVEALEVLFYELVSATREEVEQLQRARYRLLRQADDFQMAEV